MEVEWRQFSDTSVVHLCRIPVEHNKANFQQLNDLGETCLGIIFFEKQRGCLALDPRSS